MEKQGGQRRYRLVLVPAPLQGHLNPMLQLGTILHSKGFYITVAHTQFKFPNPSNHPDFKFLPIQDHLSEHDLSSGDPAHIILSLNANCEAPLQESLGQIMEDSRDKVACIIYDTLMFCSRRVANHLKLPSIILRTNSMAQMLTSSKFGQLQQDGYIPLKDNLLQEPVPGLHPLRFKDLPIFSFPNLDTGMQLTETLLNIRTSSALICNTMDCLEETLLAQSQQQYKLPFFSIGPLYKFAQASSSSRILDEDTSCITWLDKQTHNSVIYVSLGSLASMDEKELIEMAWGLANSGQPFLWVIRPNSVRGSEWIELLPEGFREAVVERGCIVKWAPQTKVLAHGAVGGFWSHCGWNSTLESICEGVPLMCQPHFGDQMVNARYISNVWRVGLELENELERGEIARTVRSLMVDAEGRELRQRVMELKEKVEACTKKDGSSYNSLNKLTGHILSY